LLRGGTTAIGSFFPTCIEAFDGCSPMTISNGRATHYGGTEGRSKWGRFVAVETTGPDEALAVQVRQAGGFAHRGAPGLPREVRPITGWWDILSELPASERRALAPRRSLGTPGSVGSTGPMGAMSASWPPALLTDSRVSSPTRSSCSRSSGRTRNQSWRASVRRHRRVFGRSPARYYHSSVACGESADWI